MKSRTGRLRGEDRKLDFERLEECELDYQPAADPEVPRSVKNI